MPYQTADIVSNLPVQPLHILQVIDSLQFASASISNFRAGRTNFGANAFTSSAQVEMHTYGGLTPLTIYSGSNQVLAIDASGNTVITGSLKVSGSNTLIGTKTITGSVFINGSKTIVGTNTVTGSLNVAGTTTIVGGLTATSLTGSFSGSLIGTATSASNIFPAITNNTNNYVLTATGNGVINGESNLVFDGTNLGIATTSPIFSLDVNGTVAFRKSTSPYYNQNPFPTKVLIHAGSGSDHIIIQSENHDTTTVSASFEYPIVSYYAVKDGDPTFSTSPTGRISFTDRNGTSNFPGNVRTSDILFKTARNWNGVVLGQYLDTTMAIVATQDGGRVGIRISNPSASLHVSGTVMFPNLTATSSLSNVVVIDTTTGQLYYTSSAVGGVAGNVTGSGVANYISIWSGSTSLTTSSLYQSSSNIGIGVTAFNSTNPEKLLVSGSTINTIVGKANLNNYTQLNIVNTNAGTAASADVVATNDTGTENGNYVNMGINSSTFAATATSVGGPNDAYLYNTGSAGANLWVGNTTPGANSSIKFFAGNVGTYAAMTMASSSLTLTGSLVVTGSVTVTGSLLLRSGSTNDIVGTTAAMVAGKITVLTTAVTANSKVFVSYNTYVGGGGSGSLYAPSTSIIAGQKFGITSSYAGDTSTVNWFLIN